MVVSYTNGYGHIDPYNQHQPVNTIKTNADGGGNGGGGTFFKMFEEKEAEEAKRDTSISSNPLDDLYPQQNLYASEHVIKDYIDNSLLLNTEQVACSNITQHLALKSNVKETLKFLNVQAAKNMVDSKKRNYKYNSENQVEGVLPMKQSTSSVNTTSGANFFETGIGNDKPPVQKNFFMSRVI